jgi:hypothetical protein
MDDPKSKRAQEIALFHHGLIADLVHLAPGRGGGLYDELRERAQRSYCIPGSLRTHVAAETMRGWLRDYRKGGFDALLPRTRSDAGKARRLPVEVIDALVLLKEARPELTVAQVIAVAREQKLVPAEQELPLSTVHRHLERAGVMDKPAQDVPGGKDHRRFGYERAGELWMSDVMHGPAVLADGRRKRKTYLIAFIDDATRFVPYATFPPSTAACTNPSTSLSPPAMPWTSTSPSPGSWACPPSAAAPPSTSRSARRSPACASTPASPPSSSSTRPTTCAATCSRSCAC